MRIACPSCEAVYDVPDTMLGRGGRMVRCATCSHQWLPSPLEAVVAEPADAEPPLPLRALDADDPSLWRRRIEPSVSGYATSDEEDMRPPPIDDVERPRGSRWALVGWALSIVVLVGLGFSAVSWRERVMDAWPPSQRLYAALGLR